MKHLKYFEKESDINPIDISARPLVYYVEDTDDVIYFDFDFEDHITIGNISDAGLFKQMNIFDSTLASGEYTISFADINGNELPSWMNITKFTV